jgi:hypothetical protein
MSRLAKLVDPVENDVVNNAHSAASECHRVVRANYYE